MNGMNYVAFFETCDLEFFFCALEQLPKNCWFPGVDDCMNAYCMGGEL
jgi:hypothetical protein